jgi:hypothetical protein
MPRSSIESDEMNQMMALKSDETFVNHDAVTAASQLLLNIGADAAGFQESMIYI